MRMTRNERLDKRRRQQMPFMAPKKGSTEMSQTTPPAFRLLDLPPELFVRIGRYAIPYNRTLSLGTNGNGRLVLQPAITRVCKVLREELLPVFYSRNTFTYHDRNQMMINRLTSFLRRVPTACKKETLRVYVTSHRSDTQVFLESPLKFIGYGLERCNISEAEVTKSLVGEVGRMPENGLAHFRVVRRA
ncbi:hypothetical protein LTR27_009478 [Elasticomyces elasticus]|nr:hypothetical protein LTR27_009478 [Elasticomyces elasticus]